MFNPTGSSNSQIVPERADLQCNKAIPIIEQLFLAYAPMARFA